MKNFYITTAIDYTNDVVHIGHAYQKILADVLARYHRLVKDSTHFLTGTDEHGQKVQHAAEENNVSPQKFVDEIATKDIEQWKSLDISYDRFIRTTDTDHIEFAQKFFQKAKDNGDIYLAKYEGLYCEGCESNLNESDLEGGKCPLHPKQTPQKVVEENYFFALSKYQKFIEDLIENNPEFVQPEGKRKEIASFVKSGLKDFSISRQSVSWGIPVPGDSKHTIYVWFDALINYLTYGQSENCWPATVQVLGKDNQKFHAVYWPAMLKSAGYELPQTILVHDFINLNGQKISKSLGNVITPTELVSKFTTDGTRYFFIKYGPLNNDIDITLDKIQESYNSELANGLGNLVARTAALCEKSGFNFPKNDRLTIDSKITTFLEKYQINLAIEVLWQKISETDKLINTKEPWKLSGSELKDTLSELVTRIRQIAFELQPFLPQTAKIITEQFGQEKIKAASPIFPRI